MSCHRRQLLQGLASFGFLGSATLAQAEDRISRTSEDSRTGRETDGRTDTRGDGSTTITATEERTRTPPPPPPPQGAKVLEVFMAGGFSCFDTIMGCPANAPWPDERVQYVSDAMTNAVGRDYSWRDDFDNNGFLLSDAASVLLDPSSALYQKWRMVHMQHNLNPHEAAAPYTLTGTSIGRPNHAGMAAAVDAVFGPTANAPTAYVIYHQRIRDALTACATGIYGAETYPVLIEATAGGVTNAELYEREERPTDALLALAKQRYAERLEHASGAVRSAGHDAYTSATGSLDTSSYADILTDVAAEATATEVMLQLAADLLALPDTRYVCIIDPHYDTHGTKVRRDGDYAPDSSNYHNERLARILNKVNDLAETGEIPLDTMHVAITTEFGRRFEGNFVETQTTGTGHNPEDYGQLVLGMAPTSNHYAGPIPPAKFRAGLLHAAGVDALAALGEYPDTLGTQITSGSGAFYSNQLFG